MFRDWLWLGSRADAPRQLDADHREQAPDAGPVATTKAEPASSVAAPSGSVVEPTSAAGATLPASAPVPSPGPAALAEPNTPAPSSAIPWDDLPQASAKGCEELASVEKGPKGFLLQRAVTNAQRALLKGDAAAAHASFCTAAHLGIPSDAVLLGLTQVLLMQSDLTGALKMVDELLTRAPANKQALEWRGDILIRMGRVDEAREAWVKSAGATHASKLLIANLLRASDLDEKTALRSGDLSRADRMLRRSIALTSGDPAHCRELMAVLTKSGHTAAAERWRGYVSALGG
jgi:Flp pilus assembly protein TadD